MRSPHHCLNENSAYILFYLRDMPPTPQIGPAMKSQDNQYSHMGNRDEINLKQKLQTNVGPSYASVVKSSPTVSGNQKVARPVGVAPQQQKLTNPTFEARNHKFSAQSSQKICSVPSNDVGRSVKSPLVPLSSDRDKVKFSFGEKSKPKETHKTPEKPKAAVKPEVPASSPKPISRVNSNSSIKSEASVCLKVTNGQSYTIETSPDGGRRIINQSKKPRKRRKIVPYGSDSDSSGNSSPSHNGSPTSESCKKENGQKKSRLVLDEALNATTSVPGNAHLYNTVTMKDKVSHASSHHDRRPKDLKVISSKHGQSTSLKRQFSETLSCETEPAQAKHSGTGEWHTSLESMQSPSIGSSSSSVHSSGSTHEWSVLKKNNNPSYGCPERKHDGWTVTPGRKDAAERSAKDARADRVEEDCSSPFEDVSDRALLIKPEKPKDKNSEDYRLYKKWKKHKKHKKRKHHEREHNYAELSEDESPGRSHKKKKKKHKHRDEEREENIYREVRDEGKEDKRYKEVREEKEDKKYNREVRDVDDDMMERHRSKGEKRHKKHERAQEESLDRHKDRSDKKQQGRKYDREYDEGYRHKNREEKNDRHHRHKHDREINDTSHNRRRKDSESSGEFEWVEKPVPVRPSVSEPVTPSHRWDHHINDGYKRKSSSGTSTPTVSRSWDGLKASKVAQELEKVSSYCYGAPVSGWDGSKSQLDIDKEREYVSRKRKDSDDEYDDEFDRGKVKKLKQHKHHNEHHHNSNMFQQKQDQINRSKINWSSIKVGDNNPFTSQNKPDRPQYYPNKT